MAQKMFCVNITKKKIDPKAKSQIMLRGNVLRHHFYLPEIICPKWQWSTQQASFMSYMHGTSLLSKYSSTGVDLL